MTEAIAAPELSGKLDWLNAPKQRLADCRGRITALVFWNASSTYCHTLLSELGKLRARHSASLSLIGIHQPKFDAEHDGQTVLKVANLLGLQFPIANDRGWVTWQHYGVRSWPSVAIIDTHGQLRELIAGDDQMMAISELVERLIDESGGTRAAEAIAFRNAEPRMPLCFPTGLLVTDNLLYVADTGHHRILECTHEGRILREFGNGHPDLVDGKSDECSFRFPRGLCWLRDTVYVADAGNHALRRINPIRGEVDTLLGNGKAGLPKEGQPAVGSAVQLNQPWDVAGANDKLYLALAGCHQIWEYELGAGRLRCVAGSGEFGIADGVGKNALFAQPAGLALVQQTLYVADAASSSIRTVQILHGSVQTVVGQGLYEFGERDGPRKDARLQYPLALALDPDSPILWIADSYNGSIRQIRLGGGDVGTHNLPHALHQPCGLAAGARSLWIADTTAHEVLRYDLGSGLLRRIPIGE